MEVFLTVLVNLIMRVIPKVLFALLGFYASSTNTALEAGHEVGVVVVATLIFSSDVPLTSITSFIGRTKIGVDADPSACSEDVNN